MILKNKKAQIATTLTWFAAFIAIFFMTLLFMRMAALLSSGKEAPEVSDKTIGSKMNGLGASPAELRGYDPGDLELQGDLNVFLNQKVLKDNREILMKDFVAGFEDKVFDIRGNRVIDLSEFRAGLGITWYNDEIKQNENFNSFYVDASRYFDALYDECYVLCLEKNIGGVNKSEKIIGKNCSLVLEGGNIYQRYRNNYRCEITSSEASWRFSYAKFNIFDKSGGLLNIKLLKGNLFPYYPL